MSVRDSPAKATRISGSTSFCRARNVQTKRASGRNEDLMKLTANHVLQRTRSTVWRAFWFCLPTQCVLCGQSLHSSLSLCTGCVRDLPVPVTPCQCCGQEMANPDDALCARCRITTPSYAQCRSALRYEEPVSGLITGFKYSARFDYGRVLAHRLATAMTDYYDHAQHSGQAVANCWPDYLLPIPLHKRKLRQRGFNQALEICKTVSRATGIPIERGLLCRRKHNSPQSEQRTKADRQSNVRGAFSIHPNFLPLPCLRYVALIDDVVTTGATAEEAALALRHGGVERVDVWCLARANR